MLGDDQPEVASAVQTVLKRADELIAPWRVVVLLMRVTADEHSSAAFWHRSA